VKPMLFATLLAGCAVEPGPRPPVPRFEIDPEYVPEGDGHETPVTLDGAASADELDDPGARLRFEWSFDADVRFVEGDRHDPTIVVTLSGTRPVTVTLAVEDEDELVSRLSRRIGLVLPE